jgi:hypothetical protein
MQEIVAYFKTVSSLVFSWGDQRKIMRNLVTGKIHAQIQTLHFPDMKHQYTQKEFASCSESRPSRVLFLP